METQQLQYKLPVFEGPLDLLLTLISKNKIDIYDIQIADLLDQYMEQITRMQENQMDIASEFLTMASRLVYIKSVMLLPKYVEEAEELKKELSGQLLEYAVCREIAAKLGTIYDFDTFFRAASPVEYDMTYNRSHPPETIAKGGVHTDTLVSLIDVGPTLIELCGGTIDYPQCGKSLCGVLDGTTPKPRDYVLSELSGEVMYMDEDYKALVNTRGEIYMLFDRKNDKEEQYNLAASEEAREIENSLRAKIMNAIAENVIIPSTVVQADSCDPYIK